MSINIRQQPRLWTMVDELAASGEELRRLWQGEMATEEQPVCAHVTEEGVFA